MAFSQAVMNSYFDDLVENASYDKNVLETMWNQLNNELEMELKSPMPDLYVPDKRTCKYVKQKGDKGLCGVSLKERSVDQVNTSTDELIKEFKSLNVASKELEVDKNVILQMIEKQDQSKKYYFRYSSDSDYCHKHKPERLMKKKEEARQKAELKKQVKEEKEKGKKKTINQTVPEDNDIVSDSEMKPEPSEQIIDTDDVSSD